MSLYSRMGTEEYLKLSQKEQDDLYKEHKQWKLAHRKVSDYIKRIHKKEDRIIQILKEHPNTDMTKLSEEIGMPLGTINQTVWRLKKKGKLDRIRYGSSRR